MVSGFCAAGALAIDCLVIRLRLHGQAALAWWHASRYGAGAIALQDDAPAGVGARPDRLVWGRLGGNFPFMPYKHNAARRHRIPPPLYSTAIALRHHRIPRPLPRHELVGVPPRASAVPCPDKGDSAAQGPRDRHISLISHRILCSGGPRLPGLR